MTQSAKCH